jgi:transcriptional regulator with XRE-family HTH domain
MASTTAASRRNEGESPRRQAQDIDLHVGARMRERRIVLGLTLQQLADLLGVTYQQASKYEKGVNRIAAGRLHRLARALGVEVGYFFEGLGSSKQAFKPTGQQRLLLDLARNFVGIADPRQRAALCDLARASAADETAEAQSAAAAVLDQRQKKNVA